MSIINIEFNSYIDFILFMFIEIRVPRNKEGMGNRKNHNY